MAIEVSFRKQNAFPILQLTGRLSEADSDTVAVAFNALQRETGAVVVLDLSKLNFIDSQGLGKLVSLNAAMIKDQRKLVILNTNPDPDAFVPSLFLMTNLAKILTIVKSIEDI